MLNALRGAPYYDDYDSTKQYTQLLAIPGRVAQAREITQIQSTVKDIIKSIGDSILKDGNIIEGCQVLTFTDSGERKARVTAGKVYMNGMVLPVAETVVDITGVGSETIGVKLVEEIITENIDPTLRDPAQGYANYTQPGCNRLKSSVSIVANDTDASILTTLIDGEIAVESYAPEYDTMTQTLARRTYDESGSYVVDGLKVRIEENIDDTKFNVVIESGKAYILGYERKIPAPRRIPLPRSLETVPRTARHHRYTGYDVIISNTPYIKELVEVKGTRERTITQSISSNTESKQFDELYVSAITSVVQGGTTFTVGDENSGDCYLYIDNANRSFIKWRGVNTPTLGASYTVTYEYEYTFIQGTDYSLSHNTTTDSQSVSWIEGGITPLNNTALTITYNLYKARKDVIYIDQYGNIAVTQGIPNVHGDEMLPEAPVNTLPLAYVISPPAGDTSNNVNLKIEVSNIGLTRFTMNDIQRLLNRIRTIEYDQAILSLNNEAKQFSTVNDKKGVWTEPFIDLSKIDHYYNLSEGIALDEEIPIYDTTIDLMSNICYLPVISHTYDTDYNNASTAYTYGRTATLAKTGAETVVLSQMNATKSFLINPYSTFPQLPEISIDPAVDVWIEDSIISIPVSKNTSEVVSTSSRNIDTYQYGNSWSYYNASSSSSSTADTTIGTRVVNSTADEVIRENSILYIRQREINVQGSLFPSNLDNIKCYFDGVVVPLTITGTTLAGTEAGSVKSNAEGNFTAKFTIPSNVKTGIREVRLQSETEVEGYENSAFTLYQASGTSRTIQRTVTTLTTVLLNRVTTVNTYHYYVDPIGQTFVLDNMTMLSGIDLYFESKPTGTTPVTCDIREVVNGNITSTIYGHKTLYANQVSVSSDSRTATRFIFDDPVLLEENKEYAFVVRSTSTQYRIWTAELGENDIITTEPVLSNPYLIGVMMSSSNNSSWTSHQTTDIKFRLISDNYVNSSEIVFDNISSDTDFSRLYLLAESIIPDNTSITWQYSIDSGVNYTSIAPYNMTLLNQMCQSLLLKATLTKSATTNISPIVALDSVSAVLSSYSAISSYAWTKSDVSYFTLVENPVASTIIYSDKECTTVSDTVVSTGSGTITGSNGTYTRNLLTDAGAGWYISKEITGLSNYTTVDIILDSYIPTTSTKVDVWVSNGSTMVKATLEDSKDMSYSWKEQTYSATVAQSTTCRLYIRLSSEYAYNTPAVRRLRMIMS